MILRKRKPIKYPRESTSYSSPSPKKRRKSYKYRSKLSVQNMPDDCILSIFKHVPVEQMSTLERVCSHWNDLAQVSWKSRQSLHIWSLLERGWRKYGDLNFEPQCLIRDSLARCGDQLTRVSFVDCPPFRLSRYTIEMIGQRCPNLESLDLGGRVLAESAIHGLLTMPKLRCLSLAKCFESANLAYEARKNIDRSLGEVLPKLLHLRTLNMKGNRGVGTQGGKSWFCALQVSILNVVGTGLAPAQFQQFVADNVGRITEFRASESTFTCGSYWYSLTSSGRDVQMSQLAKNLIQSWKEQLTRLELTEFTQCFEEEFRPMMRTLPSLCGLVELRLSCNKLVNDDLLAQICLQCTKLRTLSVAGCAVTAKGLDRLRDLDDLRHLDASKLKCVTDVLLAGLAFKMTLETVTLTDCGSRLGRDGLMALVLNCPNLQRLDVRGCKRVSAELAADLRQCQLEEFLCSTTPTATAASASTSPPHASTSRE